MSGRSSRGADPEAERPALATGFRLPRTSRIRHARDIRSLLRRGSRRKTSHLEVFVAPTGAPQPPRFGLIVPRHRHTAVQRNLLKRRLRELGRTEVLPRFRAAGVSIDFMVRARREAYGARYPELRRELVEVAEAVCSSPSSWR